MDEEAIQKLAIGSYRPVSSLISPWFRLLPLTSILNYTAVSILRTLVLVVAVVGVLVVVGVGIAAVAAVVVVVVMVGVVVIVVVVLVAVAAAAANIERYDIVATLIIVVGVASIIDVSGATMVMIVILLIVLLLFFAWFLFRQVGCFCKRRCDHSHSLPGKHLICELASAARRFQWPIMVPAVMPKYNVAN